MAARAPSIGGNDRQPQWLQKIRRSAEERFAELGFPTSRLEDWKFTNVGPIANTDFQPAANGRPAGLPGPLPGVRVVPLADALADPLVEQHLARHAQFDSHSFAALNTAFLAGGTFIEVAKGAALTEPIRLEFLAHNAAQPQVSHPRNLIVVGPGAQVSFIESYSSVGQGVHWTNAVTEIVVGDNAVVDYYRVQMEDAQSFHVATIAAHQGRSSVLAIHNLSFGAALARYDTGSVLDAEGAECTLNGLYLAAGRQHVDNHTTLDHAKPHCSSRELYKGILNDRSSAVFNGKIVVRKDAQKTDSKQTNKNLLLSEDATINTKPQLEIWADDVKCTHGATIGQLGEEPLFYLRSRGIPEDEARAMLTYAFAADVLARVKLEPLRLALDRLLLERLRGAA